MSKVSVAETEAENWCEDRKISVYSGNRTWVLSICRQALNLCTTTTALLTLLSTFGLYRPGLNWQQVFPTMLISLGIRLKTGWQWNYYLPCLPIVWWFTHRDFQLVQFNDKRWKSKAEQKKRVSQNRKMLSLTSEVYQLGFMSSCHQIGSRLFRGIQFSSLDGSSGSSGSGSSGSSGRSSIEEKEDISVIAPSLF